MSSDITLSMPFTWTGGFYQTDPFLVPPPTVMKLEQRKEEDATNLATVGGIVGAVVAALVAVGAVVICTVKRRGRDLSDTEMECEAVEVARNSRLENVLDNPLWALRDNADTDDPFQADFEEAVRKESVLGGGF